MTGNRVLVSSNGRCHLRLDENRQQRAVEVEDHIVDPSRQDLSVKKNLANVEGNRIGRTEDRSGPVPALDRRKGDVISVYADTKKANDILGWKAEKTMEEALDSAWKWEQKLGEN